MTDGHPVAVYLDTNAFILLAEGTGDARDVLSEIVGLGGAGARVMFATSELTLAEVLVKPFADERNDLVVLYEHWFGVGSWVQVKQVRLAVLRGAARLRAMRTSLKLPDAIHYATAISAGCQYMISADRNLRQRVKSSAAAAAASDGSMDLVGLDALALADLKARLIAQ
jgi:predicted nucleic acid-binding protein